MEGHATIFSREWWITVFLVGLAIHLLASYLKPRLDQIGGWFSRSWASRNGARAKARQKRIDTFKQSRRARANATIEEFRAHLGGLKWMGMALTLFVLFAVLAIVVPHPKANVLDLAIIIFATIGVFLSLNEFSKANNLYGEMREAEKQKLDAKKKQLEAENEKTLSELGIQADNGDPNDLG